MQILPPSRALDGLYRSHHQKQVRKSPQFQYLTGWILSLLYAMRSRPSLHSLLPLSSLLRKLSPFPTLHVCIFSSPFFGRHVHPTGPLLSLFLILLYLLFRSLCFRLSSYHAGSPSSCLIPSPSYFNPFFIREPAAISARYLTRLRSLPLHNQRSRSPFQVPPTIQLLHSSLPCTIRHPPPTRRNRYRHFSPSSTLLPVPAPSPLPSQIIIRHIIPFASQPPTAQSYSPLPTLDPSGAHSMTVHSVSHAWVSQAGESPSFLPSALARVAAWG